MPKHAYMPTASQRVEGRTFALCHVIPPEIGVIAGARRAEEVGVLDDASRSQPSRSPTRRLAANKCGRCRQIPNAQTAMMVPSTAKPEIVQPAA
jgi:hypothetical protein